jgi:16S rRNA pseudouridine516 synthase
VGERIDPALLRVDGQAIEHPAGLLVMLHKPVGYVCTHGSGEGPTVYDLLPERWMNRIPPPSSVGRLDKDTSGLLLITDDGDLIHRWTSPRGGSLKVYEAEVDPEPQAGAEALFASGEWRLEGEAKACRPATLERVGAGRVRVTVTEGKYHQVRRMLAGAGAGVRSLHRVRFGDYELGELAVGSWRVLERPG